MGVKRLIGYVILNSGEELIAWQKANEYCDVIAIMPMVSGLKMQFEGQIKECAEREKAEGTTGIGAFVTFAYPYEEVKRGGD